MAELTEKQKKFCDYYIETLNAAESARRAGYSEKTADRIGHENLNKIEIKKYIESRLKSKDNKRIAAQDEVMEYLTKVMRGEEKEYFFDMAGNECEKKLSVKDRSKAAELLGKRYALFTEKVEHSGNVGVNIIDDIK